MRPWALPGGASLRHGALPSGIRDMPGGTWPPERPPWLLAVHVEEWAGVSAKLGQIAPQYCSGNPVQLPTSHRVKSKEVDSSEQ